MTTWTCPEHPGQVKFVPPGVSGPSSRKPGTPYPGFFCCPVKGCEQRPPKEGQQVPPARATTSARPVAPKSPDWDRIAEGKCRSLAIAAWIQSNRSLDEFWPVERDILHYMMAGKTPGFDERALDERWENVPPDADIPFDEDWNEHRRSELVE